MKQAMKRWNRLFQFCFECNDLHKKGDYVSVENEKCSRTFQSPKEQRDRKRKSPVVFHGMGKFQVNK